MTQDVTSILRKEEQITLYLRGLYERCGFRKYRMSKFEEYDLYLENKSDKDLTIEAGSVSVNDIMIDPYYTETVAAGKVKFSVLSWEDFELEEKEITEIEKVEMEISGYGETDYLDIIENIDLEDLFSEDSDITDILTDMSLFNQSVTYQPVK